MRQLLWIKKVYLLLLLILVLPLCVLNNANAANITLAWDANTEENLAGYKIHYGLGTGNYVETIDVGNVTEFTITNIEEDVEYFFAATAYNTEGDESGYSNEVSHIITSEFEPMPLPASGYSFVIECTVEDIIIDNGDPGTSYSGTWIPSAGLNYYGEDSLYNKDWNTGYQYRYETPITGKVTIEFRHTVRPTRCTEVPIDIYDTEILIDTIYINQMENGGEWNVLGTYIFFESATVVVRTVDGSCSTSVDAVRFRSQ